jgi:hypothetical protein
LTPLFGGGEGPITLVKFDTETPVDSGSIDFADNVLAFHTSSDDPSTVTYTVSSAAEKLDNVEAEEDED